MNGFLNIFLISSYISHDAQYLFIFPPLFISTGSLTFVFYNNPPFLLIYLFYNKKTYFQFHFSLFTNISSNIENLHLNVMFYFLDDEKKME